MCVTVLYLVQLHHDSQVLGELVIVEFREGFTVHVVRSSAAGIGTK